MSRTAEPSWGGSLWNREDIQRRENQPLADVCSKCCRNDCRGLQRLYFDLFSLVLEIVLVRLVRRDGAVCVTPGVRGGSLFTVQRGTGHQNRCFLLICHVVLLRFQWSPSAFVFIIGKDVAYPHSCDRVFVWICLLCFPLRFWMFCLKSSVVDPALRKRCSCFKIFLWCLMKTQKSCF